MAVKERPFGVTVLAILEVISAVALFGLAALRSTLRRGFPTRHFNYTGYGVAPRGVMVGGVFMFVQIVAIAIFVIVGVVDFIVAYGLWTGKGWGWTAALILAIIGVLLGIFSLPYGIVNFIIDVLIVFYLTRPRVKAFFGKAQPVLSPPTPPSV